MAQKKIVDTTAYVATHGMAPRTWPGKAPPVGGATGR